MHLGKQGALGVLTEHLPPPKKPCPEGLWRGSMSQGVEVSYSSDGKESSCNAGDPSLIPGLGKSTREGPL